MTKDRASTADPLDLTMIKSARVRVARISGRVLGECDNPLASFGLN